MAKKILNNGDIIVVIDGDREEYLTPEEFSTAYGDEAKNFIPSAEETITADEIYYEYWSAAMTVVRAWSAYQGVKKLYINASHPETWYKVSAVVKKSYDGKLYKVKDRERQLSKQLDKKLADFAKACQEFSIEPVSRDWLYKNLKNAADYASIRGKIERRMNKPPISLKQLV